MSPALSPERSAEIAADQRRVNAEAMRLGALENPYKPPAKLQNSAYSKRNGSKQEFQPFAVTALSEASDTPREQIIQRLIEPGSVVAFGGAPGTSKTALGVHMVLHVAAEALFFGLKTKRSPVLFVAAEAPGSAIMRLRAAAARLFPDQTLPVYLTCASPRLGDEEHSYTDSERLMVTMHMVQAMEGEPVRLVVLDTLAACLGEGDENSDGMLRIVAAARRIAHETGAAVVLLHHPSKGDSAGLRGHGSLMAAADTVLLVTVEELSGLRTATLVKSRDSATGLQLVYELDVVTLPEPDSFGDPRTTIVVKPVASDRRPRRRPKGAAMDKLLTELERRHRTGETAWAEATVREAGRGIGMHRNSAGHALNNLISAGFITGNHAHLTLIYPPECT